MYQMHILSNICLTLLVHRQGQLELPAGSTFSNWMAYLWLELKAILEMDSTKLWINVSHQPGIMWYSYAHICTNMWTESICWPNVTSIATIGARSNDHKWIEFTLYSQMHTMKWSFRNSNKFGVIWYFVHIVTRNLHCVQLWHRSAILNRIAYHYMQWDSNLEMDSTRL